MSGLQGGSTPEDFDLGFEDEEEGVPESRFSEILPETPFLEQQKLKSNIHGTEAESFMGRISSPMLFAQQSLFPQVSQLRCWKMVNGVPTGIGVIGSDSNEEDFVGKFRPAMPNKGEGAAKFKLRPLDMDGRELGQEITLVISEHHSALGGGVPPNGGGTPHIPKYVAEQQTMQSVIDMLKSTLLHSQSALREERTRSQTLLEQMAQERIDLASNAASGVQVISERMMDADSKRHESMLKQESQRNQQVQDNMAAFFQSQTDMQHTEKKQQAQNYQRQQERDQTFHQMLLEMEQQRRERDKNNMDSMREREATQAQMVLEQERGRRERELQDFHKRQEQQRQEWEQRRIHDKDEYERKDRQRQLEIDQRERRLQLELKEKEQTRLRQHEMRLKELEQAAQRDREHAERMMQLQALQVQQDKQGSFKETMKDAMETLQGFGIDPVELASKMFGNDDSGNTENIIGALSNVAGKVADVVKENVRAQGTTQAIQAQAHLAQQQAPPAYGMVPYGPGHQPLTQQQMVHQQQMAHQHEMAQQQQMAHQQEMEELEMEEEGRFQEVIQEPVTLERSPKKKKPKGPKIDLPLSTQKLARKALRTLRGEVIGKPPETWETPITEALVNEPAIYHYCQAVSVGYALKEAACDPQMIMGIMNVLRNSSLVPHDLNYGVVP